MRTFFSFCIALVIFAGFGFWAYQKQPGAVLTRHLILAHNLPVEHPVHLGMEYFAEELKKSSSGNMQVTIYPAAQLGTEKDVLELVQLGAISMTKVSSLSLENFAPLVGIINLPYIFNSVEHNFACLDAPEIGEKLLEAPVSRKLRGLTFYDAGNRNFYAGKPILKPDDLKGLKIRVMENPTAIKMLQLMGGSPTPMPYGEVYTALQQGVIDGAENNITGITVNRHGEVAKFYSRDEHVFAPDILVISEALWKDFSEQEQRWVRSAADSSKIFQRELWKKKNAEYEKFAAEKMGVQFFQPDKKLFQEKVLSLHEEYKAKGPEFAELIEAIKAK